MSIAVNNPIDSERDKILFENRWVRIYERDEWYTFYKPVSDGLVVVLGYATIEGELQVLGRYENCPPHGDGITLTSLTGAISVGEDPAEAARRELYEESGYNLSPELFDERADYLGVSRGSKMSANATYVFGVDVTGLERHDAPGDGTQGEADAYCAWVSVPKAALCKCPYVSQALMGLAVNGIINMGPAVQK